MGSSLESVEVVQFLDELIVLEVNEKTLLSLQFKDGRLTPLAAIEMPSDCHGNKNFQVIRDIAAVFQIEARRICILYRTLCLNMACMCNIFKLPNVIRVHFNFM